MALSIRSRVARLVSGAPEPLVFDDSFGSWEAAESAANGYDSREIIDRVVRSTRAVKAGSGLFERDGIVFHNPEYRWPVAYALAASAAAHGELRVLDVGGSLGSVYWQHRGLLTPDISAWTILEQKAFVDEGRSLDLDPLTFATDLVDAERFGPWHVALFSSVLQYVPQPWETLASILDTGVDYLVIDRTPLHPGPSDIPTLQRVPAHIYPASYPAWILSESRLQQALNGWQILARFPGIEPAMRTSGGTEFTWSGLIATRAGM